MSEKFTSIANLKQLYYTFFIIYHYYIKFVEMGIFGPNKRVENCAWSTEGRIQDKEYLEMFDQGLCLSMHQPYASLLVAGIKT